MAALEHKSEEKEDDPCVVEQIAVRSWSLGGKSHQDFVIGSGVNFDAPGKIAVKVINHYGDEVLKVYEV